jgi:hypothetical protein
MNMNALQEDIHKKLDELFTEQPLTPLIVSLAEQTIYEMAKERNCEVDGIHTGYHGKNITLYVSLIPKLPKVHMSFTLVGPT